MTQRTAKLHSVMMFAMTPEIPWVAEVEPLQIGIEELVVYNSGPDDPLDPDEPIREVIHLAYQGGFAILVTDHSLYVMDKATFQASVHHKRPQRRV